MPKGERGTSRPFQYKGSKNWYIRYTPPGEKEKIEATRSPDKEVAKRLLRQRLREIDERKVTITDADVGDLLKLYLADQKRQGRHSYQQAEGYVRLHLDPAFGPIKASKLGSNHIESFIDQKQVAKYANATINRWLEALRRAYKLGMERLPPLVYVAPNIKGLMLEEDNVREGFLEHEQYVLLRDELPDHQRLILVIGYHFGMRRGEILCLRWDQVDWDGNVIRLEKKQTKGKKARVRAGVPELLVHDLRRTAARNMIRAGLGEKLTLEIVGWKTRAMLDRYNITDERDVQMAGEKMARFHEEKARLAEVRRKVRRVEDDDGEAETDNPFLIQ